MWLAILAAGAMNIGTNVHLPPPDTLDLEADLGARWVRIDFNWNIAEPAEGQFDWAPFDAVIDAANARGLEVYATIGYTPAWASTGDRLGDGSSNDVPDPAKLRAFVEAAVARYKTKVAVFGTWNEPNLTQFFEGSRDEWIADVYTPEILGIRAQCPSCTIAGPEVATIGTAYPGYIAAALAAEVPTILSAHIYAAFPEDDGLAGITKDSFYNKLDMHRVIGPYEGPLSIRESEVAAGQPNLPVWITETGYQAAITDATALAAQQQYVQRVLDAMDSRPWWGGTIFYELSEEHPGGMWPDIHWGLALRTHDPSATPLIDFEVKPAFDYLKMRLAQAAPGADAGATADAGTDTGGRDASVGPDAPFDDSTGTSGHHAAGCACATGPGDLGIVLALAAFGIPRRRRRGQSR